MFLSIFWNGDPCLAHRVWTSFPVCIRPMFFGEIEKTFHMLSEALAGISAVVDWVL
jgi:hypothetical protein